MRPSITRTGSSSIHTIRPFVRADKLHRTSLAEPKDGLVLPTESSNNIELSQLPPRMPSSREDFANGPNVRAVGDTRDRVDKEIEGFDAESGTIGSPNTVQPATYHSTRPGSKFLRGLRARGFSSEMGSDIRTKHAMKFVSTNLRRSRFLDYVTCNVKNSVEKGYVTGVSAHYAHAHTRMLSSMVHVHICIIFSHPRLSSHTFTHNQKHKRTRASALISYQSRVNGTIISKLFKRFSAFLRW